MATPDTKVNVTAGATTAPKENAVKPSIADEQDAEMDAPFTYTRSITIKAIEKESAYRQQNISVMGRRRSNIGSSINSTNILCSNAGEVNAYFPNIIGISPNNPNFFTKVKDYLSNIQVPVDDKVTFNNSLIFNHKRDYIKFANEEKKINDAYEAVDKRDVRVLKSAISTRVMAMTKLESEVYNVATPVKVTDYIMYRHCMLYNSVAKDVSLANSDSSIRFYLVDEVREKNKQAKLLKERKDASANFIALCGNDDKFDAVFVRYCTDNSLPLADYMLKDRTDRELMIDSFSRENPGKFNAICKDNNLVMVALIERLIARGELVKSEYNQQISTADGNFIGKNMNDAVAYFNNPENKGLLDSYKVKLKLMN